MHTPKRHRRTTRLRHGLSLAELMIASAIVAMMLAALAALAATVDSGHGYCHGRSIATQHARIALQRITRNLNGAHASEDFPGFVSFAEASGPHTFPDTVVIWRPVNSAANPEGLPLVGELVLYCPNPVNPNVLWEVTHRTDTRVAPPLTDVSRWGTLLTFFKEGEGPERVEVTNLLRTGNVSGTSGAGTQRAAIRFDTALRPTEAELANYAKGDLEWNEISWVQSIYSNETGLRQAWCSVELQLLPPSHQSSEDPYGMSALGFFGSGAVYYQISK